MPRSYQTTVGGIVAAGMLLFLQSSLFATQSVTFSWLPNTEPNIAGYRIHYGTASQNYTLLLDAGNTNRARLTNLVEGTTYYFALSAYNTLGLESAFTPELSYSVPIPLPDLQLSMAPTNRTVLTVIGAPGHTYTIQASSNLRTWATLRSLTIGSNGWSTLTETNPPTRTRRFYRATAPQP